MEEGLDEGRFLEIEAYLLSKKIFNNYRYAHINEAIKFFRFFEDFDVNKVMDIMTRIFSGNFTPLKYEEIVYLRYVKKMQIKDIAEETGVCVTTVNRNLCKLHQQPLYHRLSDEDLKELKKFLEIKRKIIKIIN